MLPVRVALHRLQVQVARAAEAFVTALVVALDLYPRTVSRDEVNARSLQFDIRHGSKRTSILRKHFSDYGLCGLTLFRLAHVVQHVMLAENVGRDVNATTIADGLYWHLPATTCSYAGLISVCDEPVVQTCPAGPRRKDIYPTNNKTDVNAKMAALILNPMVH